MATKTLERKYHLTRVRAGDYLLPSNDGLTIWRIQKYEDGPSHGLDWPQDKMLWGIWRWRYTDPEKYVLDTEDHDAWSLCADGYSTRKEAIDGAIHFTAGRE
jgi:hypothetical protein